MRGSDSHSCAIAQLKTHAVTLSSLFKKNIETSFVKVGLSFELEFGLILTAALQNALLRAFCSAAAGLGFVR